MEYKEQNIECKNGRISRFARGAIEYWIKFFQNSRFKIQNSITKRGMSLLELLIYMAILSGLMVVVSDSFISLSIGRAKSEARSEVNAAIRFATEKIRQDVKGATAVTAPIYGTASSTLNITVGGVPVIYDVSSGQLRRTENAGTPIAITGTSVIVGAPTFIRIENYNTSLLATTTAIQVGMTISYNSSSTDWAYSDSIRTTISLR